MFRMPSPLSRLSQASAKEPSGTRRSPTSLPSTGQHASSIRTPALSSSLFQNSPGMIMNHWIFRLAAGLILMNPGSLCMAQCSSPAIQTVTFGIRPVHRMTLCVPSRITSSTRNNRATVISVDVRCSSPRVERNKITLGFLEPLPRGSHCEIGVGRDNVTSRTIDSISQSSTIIQIGPMNMIEEERASFTLLYRLPESSDEAPLIGQSVVLTLSD